MRQFPVVVFALLALAVAGCKPHQPPAPPIPGAAVRLPAEIVPDRYEITITPDANAKTFKGSERIGILVQGDTKKVILNALELQIDRAVLPDGSTAKVELDAKAQT